MIDLIEEEGLAANAAENGGYLRAGLEELKNKHPLIGDVRGMGLMQAMELVKDRTLKTPASAETLRLMEAARENRILIGRGGLSGNVIRISPSLNVGSSRYRRIFAPAGRELFTRRQLLNGDRFKAHASRFLHALSRARVVQNRRLLSRRPVPVLASVCCTFGSI